MTKLPLSLAYPFTAMGFVLVTVLGSLIFRERLNSKRLAGIVLVACGLMLIALSSS